MDKKDISSEGFSISRRSLLKGAGVFGLLASCMPAVSFAATATERRLAEARQDYEKAREELDRLADEVAQASSELAATMGQIEDVSREIDQIDADIERRQKDIRDRQTVLSNRMAQDYKNGNDSLIQILLKSTSFEELTSNIYYFGKISQHDKELIGSIREAQALLEQKLEHKHQQKETLEGLRAEQMQHVEEVEAKQKAAQDFTDSCSKEVQELIQQRDEEFAAAKKAAEQEPKPSRPSGGSSSGSSRPSGGSSTVIETGGSGSLSRILNSCNRVGSPGNGLCAMWVSQVFNNAGMGYPGGNANDMYWSWCHSSDRSQLKPGMIVAVPTHPHTRMGKIYGHVGIYIGGGMVMHNIGRIATQSLDSWIAYYGATTPVRWGWISGRVLS